MEQISTFKTLTAVAMPPVQQNPRPPRRVKIKALLAPELILFWAIQQWLVAGEIADINERARKGRRAVEEQRVAEGGTGIAKNVSTAEDAKNTWEGEELLRKTDEGRAGKELVDDDESVFVLFETVTIR